VLCAIASIPIYRLETIKYKQFYEKCYEEWNTAQELTELHICRNPSMRDRYRKYVKCDETRMGLIVTPKECALGVWWHQFFLVKFFESTQSTASGIYETLSGTWYIYLLCAILCVVFVWTWVNSRARLQDRREERIHQNELLTRIEGQIGYRNGGNRYVLQNQYDSRHNSRQLEYN
jgi:hypothetical protein